MSVYLPCRCGGERTDADLGSAACVDCRRRAGSVSHPELAAALARCDRETGGSTPRVAWLTEKAPHHLWAACPPAKDNPRRVLVVEVEA